MEKYLLIRLIGYTGIGGFMAHIGYGVNTWQFWIMLTFVIFIVIGSKPRELQ